MQFFLFLMYVWTYCFNKQKKKIFPFLQFTIILFRFLNYFHNFSNKKNIFFPIDAFKQFSAIVTRYLC